MGSLPEQADLETVAADKVRLLVNDEPVATLESASLAAVLPESSQASNTQIASLPNSSQEPATAVELNAEEQPTETAAAAGTIIEPVETNTLAVCLKGALSLSFVFTGLSFLAIWPSFIVCPYIMPEKLWAFNLPQIMFNAGVYSAEICTILGFMIAFVVPLFVFLECQTSRTAFNRTHKAVDVGMNERLAFELCMAAASKCTLQRADEGAGELCIEVTKRAFVDIRIESLGTDKSRIHITRNFDSDLPVLFWKQEVRQLLNNSASSGSLLAAQIERYIKSHEQFYAKRELLPAEYNTPIDYKMPKYRYNTRLATVLALVLYPLFMFSYGHSPSMLGQQARYTKNFDPPAALALYNQAIAYQKHSVPLLAERAQLLLQLHQPLDAEADYRTALKYAPGNRFLLYGLQSALILQNRLDEVVEIDDLIAMQGLDTPDVLNNRAWDQAIMGNTDNAIADANRAIAMNPQFDAAYGTRGYAYNLMGMYDQALADYTTAIQLNPQDRIDRFLRAQVLRTLGLSQQADADEQMAKEMGFYPEELALPPTFSDKGEPPVGQVD